MPIYEFACSDCEEDFEILVFRSDETIACPSCNGANVDRKLSIFGFKSSGGDGTVSSSSSCGSCASTSCSGCSSGAH